MIGEHLRPAANRENMTTATNPTARWLFPGQRAGQPLNVGTLWEELRQLGFSTAITRPSALRQLVPQAPAPVVARSLGFHDQTTTTLPPRREEPGNTTPLVTTHRHTPRDRCREYEHLSYASSPVSDPGIASLMLAGFWLSFYLIRPRTALSATGRQAIIGPSQGR